MSINVLDLFMSNLIAAGEVVDRPSSVVKELMENSLDAWCHSMLVEIRNGGVSYIRVSDDGVGIGKDDLPLAILRHATSKLKEPKDLDEILTLGFRGEALAAISSVSKLKIYSRPDGEDGACLVSEAGKVEDLFETPCSRGTNVIVEELFHNVPARRRFLKRNATETAKVTDVVEKIALSVPEIAVRYVVDGDVKFITPGDGILKHTVQSIYGKDVANRLIPMKRKNGNITVQGYIGEPDLLFGTRAQEIFFVNGRYCKSPLIRSAVERAYESKIPSDRYPFCVFDIKIAASAVDVNVHPAKVEVKFANDKEVVDSVYYAVLSSLNTVTESRPEIKIGNVYGSDEYAQNAKNILNATAPVIRSPKTEEQATLDGVSEKEKTFEKEYRRYDGEHNTDNTGKDCGFAVGNCNGEKKSIVESDTAQNTESANSEDAKFCASENIRHDIAEENTDIPKGGKTDGTGINSENVNKEASCDSGQSSGSVSADGITAEGDAGAFRENIGGMFDRETVVPSLLEDYNVPEFLRTGNFTRKYETTEENTSEHTAKSENSERNYAISLTSEVMKDVDGIPPYRIVGEVYNCYIVIELEDRMLLVDKHAAHERIIFDELCRRRKEKDIESQLLLVPIELMLTAEEIPLLFEYGDDVRSVGFDFEISDESRKVSITKVPVEIPLSSASEAFSALCARLAEGQNALESAESEFFEKALYQAACKAAIKGGRHYDFEHIDWICKKLLKKPDADGKVIKTCPHGRPVAFEIKKTSIERQFSRIE